MFARNVLLAALATGLLLVAGMAQASTEDDFIGSSPGDYNTAGNWSAGVPAGGYKGYIYGSSVVTLSSPVGPTADALDISAGGSSDNCQLQILAGASLSVGLLDAGFWYGTGTVTQTGGTVNVTGASGRVFTLGDNGTGTGSYTISGGTCNVTNGDFYLSYGASSSGSLYVQGTGALSVAGDTLVGYANTGLVTQTGGTVTFPHVYLGYNNGVTGTYNLSGGTLITNGVFGINGVMTFNFNGGTLEPYSTPNSEWFEVFGSGSANIYVKEGGAFINTAGQSTAIGYPLQHGGVGTDGGLTKLGAGTLTLEVASTYTGNTTVSGGTLSLGYADLAAASNVSIASGAVLNLTYGGTDTIHALYLNGVQQAPGTYNAGDSLGYITGSGSLLVTAPIPEPGTLSLLAAGLIGLLCYAWRKRR